MLKEPTPRANFYNTVGGKTVQRVFELFYNKEIYRMGNKVLETLEELLEREYRHIVSKTQIDWDHPDSKLSEAELLDSLRPLLRSTLQVIKDHQLLGKYARSEVRLQAWVDKVLVHGIADFVIRRDKEHMILDGKLTRHRSKYLKRDQLVWYMMLHYLQHRKVPERVGWIYYTYGELEWVPIEITDITRLHRNLESTIKNIKASRFDATPSQDACRFCDYKETCKAGQEFDIGVKWSRAEKKQKKLEASGSPLLDETTDIVGF